MSAVNQTGLRGFFSKSEWETLMLGLGWITLLGMEERSQALVKSGNPPGETALRAWLNEIERLEREGNTRKSPSGKHEYDARLAKELAISLLHDVGLDGFLTKLRDDERSREAGCAEIVKILQTRLKKIGKKCVEGYLFVVHYSVHQHTFHLGAVDPRVDSLLKAIEVLDVEDSSDDAIAEFMADEQARNDRLALSIYLVGALIWDSDLTTDHLNAALSKATDIADQHADTVGATKTLAPSSTDRAALFTRACLRLADNIYLAFECPESLENPRRELLVVVNELSQFSTFLGPRAAEQSVFFLESLASIGQALLADSEISPAPGRPQLSAILFLKTLAESFKYRYAVSESVDLPVDESVRANPNTQSIIRTATSSYRSLLSEDEWRTLVFGYLWAWVGIGAPLSNQSESRRERALEAINDAATGRWDSQTGPEIPNFDPSLMREVASDLEANIERYGKEVIADRRSPYEGSVDLFAVLTRNRQRFGFACVDYYFYEIVNTLDALTSDENGWNLNQDEATHFRRIRDALAGKKSVPHQHESQACPHSDEPMQLRSAFSESDWRTLIFGYAWVCLGVGGKSVEPNSPSFDAWLARLEQEQEVLRASSKAVSERTSSCCLQMELVSFLLSEVSAGRFLQLIGGDNRSALEGWANAIAVAYKYGSQIGWDQVDSYRESVMAMALSLRRLEPEYVRFGEIFFHLRKEAVGYFDPEDADCFGHDTNHWDKLALGLLWVGNRVGDTGGSMSVRGRMLSLRKAQEIFESNRPLHSRTADPLAASSPMEELFIRSYMHLTGEGRDDLIRQFDSSDSDSLSALGDLARLLSAYSSAFGRGAAAQSAFYLESLVLMAEAIRDQPGIAIEQKEARETVLVFLRTLVVCFKYEYRQSDLEANKDRSSLPAATMVDPDAANITLPRTVSLPNQTLGAQTVSPGAVLPPRPSAELHSGSHAPNSVAAARQNANVSSQPATKANQASQATAVATASTGAISSRSSKSNEYAGLWRRLGAYVIDSLFLLVVYVASLIIVAFMSALLSEITGQEELLDAIAPFFLMGLWVSTSYLYYVAMEQSAAQATIGKRALGIRVVDAQGQRLGWGKASARWFSSIFSYSTFFIGFFICAWTRKKQALHDLMADTYVVDKASPYPARTDETAT